MTTMTMPDGSSRTVAASTGYDVLRVPMGAPPKG